MLKTFFLSFVIILITGFVARAQQKDSSGINKDSIEREVDAFLNLMNASKKSKTYWQAGIGISNTQFSVSNVALNAQQLNSGATVIPTLGYFHKSGLSLAYNNYFLIGGSNSGIIQHSFTPAYDYSKDKAFDFGFSYTRFIGNKKFEQNRSPYQNDLYSYAKFNKWYVSPSLSFGYSTGKFNEYSKTDTSVILKRPFRPDTTINFSIYDTLKVKIRDVSVVATFQHEFLILSKKEQNYTTFTPSLLLFFAQNNYDVEYTSASVLSPQTRVFLQNRPELRDQLLRQFRTRFPNLNQTRNFLNSSNFSWQSIGLSLDAAFYFNKFYINPQIYFDYYLKEADKKFTAFYTLNTGFLF